MTTWGAFEDRRDPWQTSPGVPPAEILRRAIAEGRVRPAAAQHAPRPVARPTPTTRRGPVPPAPRPVPSMRALDNEVSLMRANRPARRLPPGVLFPRSGDTDRAYRLAAAERAIDADRQRLALHRVGAMLEARA